MLRLSHFAAPAVVAAALFVGGGCAAERLADIPLTAAEVDEGKETVRYTAPHDGRVYIYDSTSGDMLYNGNVRRGQSVRVDAKENQILVDNQVAVERDLVNDHRFKVFFDRDENANTANAIIVPATPAPTNIQVQPAPAQPQYQQPAPRTNIQVNPAPAQPAQPAPRTNIQVQPGPSSSDGAGATIQVQPAPAPSSSSDQPRTTIQTDPNAGRTTVTTPDAKITTDPDTGRTTVQPR